MTLPREVVVPGMLAEYAAFSQLVSGLTQDEWTVPSRCEGWTTGDIAGHVVGQLTDVASLRLDGLGSPEVTSRQVGERRAGLPRSWPRNSTPSLEIARPWLSAFDDRELAGTAARWFGWLRWIRARVAVVRYLSARR